MLYDTSISASAQDFVADETFDEYCERIARADDMKLEAAVNAVYAAAQLLAPHLPLVYPYGDGNGGWVWQTIIDAAGIHDRPQENKSKNYKMSRILSRSVMERDLYRCQNCGTHKDLTIDHICPRSKGGGDEMENLQTLCRSCNSKKGVKENINEQ